MHTKMIQFIPLPKMGSRQRTVDGRVWLCEMSRASKALHIINNAVRDGGLLVVVTFKYITEGKKNHGKNMNKKKLHSTLHIIMLAHVCHPKDADFASCLIPSPTQPTLKFRVLHLARHATIFGLSLSSHPHPSIDTSA